MLDSVEIKNRIAREYNNNPQGWQVHTAKDERGHIDTIFLHSDDIFILKEELVNPYKTIGVGLHEKLDVKVKHILAPSFGLRPLDFNTLQTLSTLDEREAQNSILNEVLTKNPVSFGNINAPAVIHGPITHSNKMLNIMGSKQKDIDHQLKEELDRLLERKYPHFKTMYG